MAMQRSSPLLSCSLARFLCPLPTTMATMNQNMPLEELPTEVKYLHYYQRYGLCYGVRHGLVEAFGLLISQIHDFARVSEREPVVARCYPLGTIVAAAGLPWGTTLDGECAVLHPSLQCDSWLHRPMCLFAAP